MRQSKRISQVKLIYLSMAIGTIATFILLLSEHQMVTEIKKNTPEIVSIVQMGTKVDAE